MRAAIRRSRSKSVDLHYMGRGPAESAEGELASPVSYIARRWLRIFPIACLAHERFVRLIEIKDRV